MRCAQAGNGVNHQQRVSAFHQPRDSFNIVPHAGGAFRGLHVENFMLGLQRFANLLRRNRLPVRRAHSFKLAAISFGQPFPSLAKFSCGNYQHFVAG